MENVAHELAKVRVVKPLPGGKPRTFDLEVSSDGGDTWKVLPTHESQLTQPQEGCQFVQLIIQNIPGVIDFKV